MPINILMPALSPTMTEGNLARWLKREGDRVTTGDILVEIETDKATMEVEAVDDGTLARILVPDGTEGVKVNAVIAMLLADGEDAAALDGAGTAAPEFRASGAEAGPATAAPADAAATPLARRMAAQAGLDLRAIPGSGARGKVTRKDVESAITGGKASSAAPVVLAAPTTQPARRVIASPVARRMAGDRGIDLATVAGSGPGGRVVKADVEAALATAPAPATAQETGVGGSVEPLGTMRRIIAERMASSKQTVPHFYLTVDCEIDELLAERKALNAADKDLKLSLNDFIIRAIALALIEVPDANVMWDDGNLRRFEAADIAVAVALEEGLITPVIRAADTKGLARISAEMKDLAARAREGKLAPEEYRGGTFTVSNLGMFGIKQFEAIINPPQAGILAVGAGAQQPVVKEGALAIATVMSMTLSCDHRVLDGAIGAKLLTTIKRLLEYPPQMLL